MYAQIKITKEKSNLHKPNAKLCDNCVTQQNNITTIININHYEWDKLVGKS